MNPNLTFTDEVAAAIENHQPLVALESTVISHGLPYPHNLELARELETVVRAGGATPATIGVIDGVVKIGLTDADLHLLATAENVVKLSRRDLPTVIARRQHGATTVAGTILLAEMAGIKVMATGGIGGIHRATHGSPWDVSADLPELARTAIVVVCAGAKAILDLPATLEWLETYGVPVIGYQTDQLPAFYTPTSGLALEIRADTPAEIAALAQAKWQLGLGGGLLVTAPVPTAAAAPAAVIDQAIAQALNEAHQQGIVGKASTPFLLARIAELTGGVSLQANLALLRNNARLGAEIAVALA